MNFLLRVFACFLEWAVLRQPTVLLGASVENSTRAFIVGR